MTLTSAQAQLLLRELGLPADTGLSVAELHHVERLFGFAFNPDHRALLSAGLPLGGPRWPNWRDTGSVALRRLLEAPVDGVLFDVEQNGFWLADWGNRPEDLTEALEVASLALKKVPRLVPVYGHRYTPALPEAGLPVFSVVQTDVIVYGYDMADYLRQEFGPDQEGSPGAAVAVPFWSGLTR